MKTNKLIFSTAFSILFLFVLFPIVSANGLSIIGDTSFVINKTVGTQEEIIFNIKNEDSFTFYNITFEENSIISMDMIGSLSSGENISVIGRINTNMDYSGDIIIEAKYEAFLGASQETYYIDVDYLSSSGVSECEKTMVKGDTIVWQNNVLDSISMKNLDTGETITTIAENGTYTSIFETPETLNYQFLRRGFVFTNNCYIYAQNDEGYINDPNYNALINLEININYPSTTITTTFIETNYSLNPNTHDEGFFSIKNTGSEVAKNVHINGDWIYDFSPNNFDISPGYSKTISYKILPIVTETNETDKTYIKNITIDGNFETISKEFFINVKYFDLDNTQYGNNTDFWSIFEQQWESYCEQFPDKDICNTNPNIIYVDRANSSDFNVTYNQDQVKQIFDYIFTSSDENNIKMTNLVEMVSALNNTVYSINSSQNYTQTEIQNFKEDKETDDSRLMFIIFLILTIFMIGAFVWYFINWYRNNKLNAFKRWGVDKKRLFGRLID